MHPQILDNMSRHEFYHGTSHENAASIAREGFHVRYYTDEEGDSCISSGGALGDGIYMTANPGTALYFGPVVFMVAVRPGLRILDVTTPADRAIISCLSREFGHEILTKPPRLVIPQNKHLTGPESVALFRHHYSAVNFSKKKAKYGVLSEPLPGSSRLHREMRTQLMRQGYHGFGDADEWNGIVLFAPDSIHAAGVAIELSPLQFDSERFLDFDSGGFSDGASPYRTVASVKARLAELFPSGSESYWSLPMEAEVA
jgi:hypothetical protein